MTAPLFWATCCSIHATELGAHLEFQPGGSDLVGIGGDLSEGGDSCCICSSLKDAAPVGKILGGVGRRDMSVRLRARVSVGSALKSSSLLKMSSNDELVPDALRRLVSRAAAAAAISWAILPPNMVVDDCRCATKFCRQMLVSSQVDRPEGKSVHGMKFRKRWSEIFGWA